MRLITDFISKILYYMRCLEGAGSRNVNKLLSKQKFAVFLIGHITVIFHYFSQNESVILKMDSCLVEKQTKHSYFVRLQRYWWIFRSNFSLDSPYPPRSVQNTMATCGQQYRF